MAWHKKKKDLAAKLSSTPAFRFTPKLGYY